MFRFIRSRIHSSSNDTKPEDVNEFFNYTTTLRHGFPQNLSAIAHDYVLGLIAIGTRDGYVGIYGAANVEWSSSTSNGAGVSELYFAVGAYTLVALCTDQRFHKFQINDDRIHIVTANPESRLKRVTYCAMQNGVDPRSSQLLIGTVTGNVLALSVLNLDLSEFVLFEESISLSVAIRSGARQVECISIHPTNSYKVLMLFGTNCIVFYDASSKVVIRHWTMHQPVTSMNWHYDGVQFIVSHSDGSLDTWSSITGDALEPSVIPMGPYPCTAIGKVFWACASSDPNAIKFYSGGMERSSYGDRHTITAMKEGKIVIFDFGSAVVDFLVFPSLRDNKYPDFSRSIALMVLCHQELVCIDLTDEEWSTIKLPYLHSLHSSYITCNMLYTNIEKHVWKNIVKSSVSSNAKKWPVFCGSDVEPPTPCAASNVEKRQILITGHENGVVNLWATGSRSLSHLLSIKTSQEFAGCEDEVERKGDARYDETGEDESFEAADWPPFRKVGTYDIFCDDPRLAVSKIFFDPNSGQLAVGGNSGQSIVYDIENETTEVDSIRCVSFEIIEASGSSNRLHLQKPLPPRKSKRRYYPGYQPIKVSEHVSLIVQLQPVIPITAIATLHSRNLLSLGCDYGFILCDLKSQTLLIKNCLISLHAIIESSALNGALTRFKSMKKSVRQSFRRRKRVPQNEGVDRAHGIVSKYEIEDVKPVERQIQSRSEGSTNVGDPLPSAVRVIKFYVTNLVTASVASDSFWVGTQSGLILAYAIVDDARKPEDVCVLVKEVYLQHAAPVIDIVCIGLDGMPATKNTFNVHKVMIFSEEQIKTFLLPSMKPTRPKYKLTGIEGSRLRKAQLLTLWNSSKKACEKFLVVITNNGELFLFLASSSRRCAKVQFSRAIDVVGVGSAVISSYGEIFFLKSGGSELQRATIATIPHTNLLSPIQNVTFPPKLF